MSFIELLKVIVIAIVEGFTEWLPISSTGHMMLVDELITLDMTPEFKTLFMVVIQIGAMLAIVVMFFRKLNPFDPRKSPDQKKFTWILWAKIAIASVPAAILGLLLDDWIDLHMRTGIVVGFTLIIYGVLFIVIENVNKTKAPEITKLGQLSYQTALYIGAIQCLALIPGTSRSGTTILGAMLLGCSRGVATEFSFFMGIPVIAGASFLKLIKYGFHFSFAEVVYMIVGMLVAFLVAMYSVRFFISWIKKNDFKLFGIYRIALGVIVLLWFGITSLVGLS